MDKQQEQWFALVKYESWIGIHWKFTAYLYQISRSQGVRTGPWYPWGYGNIKACHREKKWLFWGI